MKIILDVWRLLTPSQQRKAVALQIVSVLMAFSTLAGLAAILPFFTLLADPHAIHQSAMLAFLYDHLPVHDERTFSIALGIAFVAAVLAANAINLAGTLAMTRFANSVGSELCSMLFGEYLRRDYGFHARAANSVLSANLLIEVGRVSGGLLHNGLILFTNLVTVAFIVVSIVILNPLLALCACGLLGGSYALIYVSVRRRLVRNGKIQSGLHAARHRIVTESFGAIKEIIVSRSQDYFLRLFANSNDALARTSVGTQAIAQSPKYALECLTVAGLVAVALFLSGTARDTAWLARLTFFAFASYRLLPALQQAFYAVVNIRADSPALFNIAEDLCRARSAGEAKPIESGWDRRPERYIKLRAVSFRYAEKLPLAVSAATLKIPAGSMVALVGPNGAGKSALADLIVGLLTPESGRLEIDDIVVDETNRRAWQSSVAYVPQHIFLLDASVAENIALGFAGGDIDVRRLHAAARLARVDEFVDLLPERYHTRLGERGARLSGGQRQRIGIARALYRNASVLVLDEATNALDGIAEHEVVTALVALRGRRTIVVIAHNRFVVESADFVFEVVNGNVAFRGSGKEFTDAMAGNPYLPERGLTAAV